MSEHSVRIAVTGMGAVSCLGHGVTPLWQGLAGGQCGIRALTRIDVEQHRNKLAGEVPLMPSPDGEALDPAIRFALDASLEAAGAAGLTPTIAGSAALVLGSNFGAMASTERFLSGRNGGREAVMDWPVQVVAQRLGLGGIRSSISLSCASGNAAIGYAADLIRNGSAEVVLAGGYDAISDVVWAGLCSLRAMSPTALRPFDKNRDGTIFGEGAGVLVMESLEHARGRGATPLAEFLGYGTSSNAYHMTHPDPDGAGMVRAMTAAMTDAGISAKDIDHINAHATGTPLNDKTETAAIKTVLGERARSIPINGIKSIISHAMGAAGALEAIATIQTLCEGVVPPTIRLETPDPECDLDYTRNVARRVPVKIAMNNSAGFGGCNGTAIFGRWEARA